MTAVERSRALLRPFLFFSGLLVGYGSEPVVAWALIAGAAWLTLAHPNWSSLADEQKLYLPAGSDADSRAGPLTDAAGADTLGISSACGGCTTD